MPLPSVVVVDDAPEVRALIRRALVLSRRVTVVGEAGDGAAAVDLAASVRPDLMLLDVSMPTMDGLEALPRILASSPGTRVVMYTGFDEQALADRARALGASGYVEKSAPIPAVVLALLAALPRSFPGGVDVAPKPDTVADLEVAAADRAVLAEHLERFREVFEEATIGMATMTLNGHLVRANRALAELLGRPVHQLVGIRYESLSGGEDVLRRPLQTLRAGEKVVQFEHAVSGTQLRVLVTLATVRDSRSRPLYIFLQMQDVTEQRRATEALRQSEERFRLLVEAVQDYAIFMISPEGVIASWNAGAQRIKGYTAEEIVGRHFRAFYPAEKQTERHPEHELELALRDGRYEEEGWRVRKDGSQFWANVVITAVHDEAGVHIGFAKVTRDMTERRQMLDHLEAMNSKLARAAEEQSEFLAVTAHELRTPVGVLSGAAALLAAHLPELEEQDRTELRHGSPPVEITAAAIGPTVEVRISDAGNGPSEQLKDNLFQRFATGTSHSGTGLGLFIVRELARAHDGDATYELPVVGRPSGTFVLSLPRSPTDAKRSDA